jgi:uncharacterized RDD family membrane protein YckC
MQRRIIYAKPGMRVFSALLDLFLYVVLLIVLAAAWPMTDDLTVPMGFLVIAAALVFFYPVFFLTGWLATPGMMLAGIRLIDVKEGDRPGVVRLALRTLGWVAGLLLFGLGLLIILRDDRRQGLHDKMAGTLVIEDDEANKSLAELIQESK